MSEYLSNISVYETAQKVYVVGEDSEQDPNCWRLLKIDRTNSPDEDFSVVEDPTLYSWRDLQSVLRCLHEGNLSSGGLRKIAGPCPALVGALFSWSACPYLLLVTRTRVVGKIGGDNPIYGIDATTLIPLGPAGEPLPEAIAAEEARARRLLSLVALTKDFFFSFSWPIWNTVQRNFASTTDDIDPYSSDRVWNAHLTWKLRSSLGSQHCRWVVPLVHGFFEQKRLSLLGRPLLLTLVARRSCRFAGTRYRKRGVGENGEVANDVEIEQIIELIDTTSATAANKMMGAEISAPKMSSFVQVRGSVPLFWSQTWDTSTAAATAALRPSIRMLHHLDPLYTATRKHFDDLRKRYGDSIQCLDLLRHGDSRQQESVLSAEYKNAVTFLNKRTAAQQQRVGYVHWDLRRHAKMVGSNLLVDLQRVQAPLLARTGIFTTGQQQQQCGLVRTNCVDCLDRTNVAQFTFGLLAIGQQLYSLGLAPSKAPLDPGSSLAAEVMSSYEAMGHALAQQYGGSEAHTGFFKQQTTQIAGGGGASDWQANLHLHGRDLLTSIKRFYSNAVTDEDKQAAINLFLGTFSPAMAAAETAKWGGWLRGRAASATELSREGDGVASGSGGGGGGAAASKSLLLAPEPSLEDTAGTNPTNGSLRSSSLFVQGPSSPETLLPSSLSTASLASELDGGTDLSLPEILSSASAPSGIAFSSSDVDGSGGDKVPAAEMVALVTKTQQGSAERQRQHQVSVQQQQQVRKRWPPRPSARAHSNPLLDSFGGISTTDTASNGGLQSFDAMLPLDVKHVRLYSQHRPPTTARPAAAGSVQHVSAPFARGPPVPTTRLVRSNSTGDAPQLAHAALEGRRSSTARALQHLSATASHHSNDNSDASTRSSRDLRGNLVILAPGETYSTVVNKTRKDQLEGHHSGHDTLAGLNLEGAPMDLSSLPPSAPLYPHRDFTRPATAGNGPMAKAKRVSFASLSALRQFVRGGGGSDGGGSGVGSSYASRSTSALNLPTLSDTYNTLGADGSMAASAAGRTGSLPLSVGPVGSGAAAADLSWMLTQHQAVAHGLDDLGLPAHVAPLYRRGSNVVGCFVEMGKEQAEQQAAKMAKLKVPLGLAEHRAAEREVAALLRPEVVVTLPEKAC